MSQTGVTAELYQAIVAIVDDRMREIKVTREDFTALKDSVQELAQAQARTEKRLEELAQAQARTETALRELARQVGRLSDTIGFGLEDIARIVLPGYLERHYQIQVEELTPRYFEVDSKVIEVNLYGEGSRNGKKVTIIGEVKSRIYSREVEQFLANLSLISSQLEGDLVKVMFGYAIHPSATKLAEQQGVVLVASYQR